MTVQNESRPARDELTGESGDNVIDALLAELKDDQGGARKTALRRALNLDSSTSNQVRIERLQSTVESLAAYTDALEEFLDENGTANTVLADVQDDLEAADAEITTLRSDVGNLEGGQDEVVNRLDVLESTVEGLDDRVATLRGRNCELRSDFEAARDSIEDSVAEIGADLDELTARVDELDAEVSASIDALETRLGGRIDALERSIDSLEESLEDSHADLDDDIADVQAALERAVAGLEADLESSIDSLENDVTELEARADTAQEWRESLQRVLQ